MDSFPGAKWRHLTHFFEEAPAFENVEQLILSLGINRRAQRDKRAAVKEMRAGSSAQMQRFLSPCCCPSVNR